MYKLNIYTHLCIYDTYMYVDTYIHRYISYIYVWRLGRKSRTSRQLCIPAFTLWIFCRLYVHKVTRLIFVTVSNITLLFSSCLSCFSNQLWCSSVMSSLIISWCRKTKRIIFYGDYLMFRKNICFCFLILCICAGWGFLMIWNGYRSVFILCELWKTFREEI